MKKIGIVTFHQALNYGAKLQAYALQQFLEKKGIPATVRRELGADIDAACGQLRLGQSD